MKDTIVHGIATAVVTGWVIGVPLLLWGILATLHDILGILEKRREEE